jgi:ankyrin repeat protein
MVRLLLSHGARADLPAFEDAVPPIHLAVCRDHVSVMEALLERGADPNTLCPSGCLPLSVAVHAGLTEATEMLLKWGAKTSATGPLVPSMGGGLRDSASVPSTGVRRRADRGVLLHVQDQ